MFCSSTMKDNNVIKPHVGALSGHLLQFSHRELINEFQNRFDSDRVREPLADTQVLL